jgi:hypothetical protein
MIEKLVNRQQAVEALVSNSYALGSRLYCPLYITVGEVAASARRL